MTETQNTSPDHRRPLAPGELRAQWVGNQLFTVMHVAGGSYTQASVRESGKPTRVLATERFESDAVAVYAYAIECAEADALDDADDAQYISPATGELAVPGITDAPEVEQQPLKVDRAIAELRHFEEIDRVAVARGESANWWERTGDVDLTFNTPMGADMTMVTGEPAAERTAELADVPAGLSVQRAKDGEGWGIWLHTCGKAQSRNGGPRECYWCGGTDGYRPLYTLDYA